MVGGEPNFGCGRGNLLVRVSWETPRTTSVEVEAREPSGKGFLGNSPDLYFVHCHTVKKEWKVKIDVLRRVVGSWFRRSGKRRRMD